MKAIRCRTIHARSKDHGCERWANFTCSMKIKFSCQSSTSYFCMLSHSVNTLGRFISLSPVSLIVQTTSLQLKSFRTNSQRAANHELLAVFMCMTCVCGVYDKYYSVYTIELSNEPSAGVAGRSEKLITRLYCPANGHTE